MNRRLEIFSKVVDGKLRRNRKTLTDAIQAFEGKEVLITIERKRSKRSNEQNRYYWGLVIPLIQDRLNELGHRYTKDQTHENLKMWMADYAPDVMLTEITLPDTGQTLTSVKSTTELTTSGFMEYKAAIQQWAVEMLGLDIPDPEEQLSVV